MQEGSKTCSRNDFARVYIEKDLFGDAVTERIVSRLPNAKIIPVSHYKDVFARSRQQYDVQKKSRSLILARNIGRLIYEGAPVCQDFDMENFSYTNSVMNCIYDCDYCFLKGVYDTPNIVVFVNFEDYKKEVDRKLEEGPLYLCISYDTDLLALNGLTGLCDMWTDYAKDREGLTIEIRTKSSLSSFISSEHIIYAFTLSPDEVIEKYEKKTPHLSSRLNAVKAALEAGANVRLCFDPLMHIEDFADVYGRFMEQVSSAVDLNAVRDISLGTFRISADYVRRMRKNGPLSEAAWYPYDNKGGVMSYPEVKADAMTDLVMKELLKHTERRKIYLWK